LPKSAPKSGPLCARITAHVADTQVIRSAGYDMTRELIERSRRRQAFVDVSLLFTTAALVLSVVIAFTAVSIGIARADTLAPFGDVSGGRLAFAVMLGVAIAGMGGLTAAVMRDRSVPARRD
jgi:hypothetical protein